MGVTQAGKVLNQQEVKKYSKYVREKAIEQFINLYKRIKERTDEAFVWGDEIEHILIKLDDVDKTARVLPKNSHALQKLVGKTNSKNSDEHGSIWMPEMGAFQLESSPRRPFGSSFAAFSIVEANMKLRRTQGASVLDQENGEFCLTMTHLPRFGCPQSFALPNCLETVPCEKDESSYYPDVILSLMGRYRSVKINNRERRGEDVSINVPVYKDTKTTSPFRDPYTLQRVDQATNSSKVDHIYADNIMAGSTYSSLQVTFQTCHLSQAKYLYDQLIPMCPIMLALSASTPVFRGFLTDLDCRWKALSSSLDSRNKEERALKPLKKSKFVIPKAACDTASLYLSEENQFLNDIMVPIEKPTFQKLFDGGVDINLARYVSYILIRDPLIFHEEEIDQNSEEATRHFDNLLSTNWLCVRLKPPAINTEMGWRIEFRPLEVQLTDFENAAYVIFVMLLVRSLDKFKLNLAAPISKIDLNMDNAQKRDAVNKKVFYFREDLESSSGNSIVYSQMSVDVIINGGVTSSGAEFPGLIPIIHRYISTVEDADDATYAIVSRYIQLISDRAAGRVNTAAKWIRHFVERHPDYNQDSIISEQINYDLVKLISDVSGGKVNPQHLIQVSHVTDYGG